MGRGLEGKNRVCPVEHSGVLDYRFRRWRQNPRKILAPFIKEDMTVLDLGGGPGFSPSVSPGASGKYKR